MLNETLQFEEEGYQPNDDDESKIPLDEGYQPKKEIPFEKVKKGYQPTPGDKPSVPTGGSSIKPPQKDK